MTLISLLIVMALERVTSKAPEWHIHALVGRYIQFLQARKWFNETASTLSLVLISLLPALSLYLIDYLIDNGLFTFVLQLITLWVCLGCPITRKNYKRYLEAANRKDFEACSLHSLAFGNTNGDLSKVGQQLVFVNYRQYAAVIVAFICFGVAGVVFYSIAKELQIFSHKMSACGGDPNEVDEEVIGECEKANAELAIDKIMHAIDWLPVRITGLGFLIVGHFSRALTIWLPSLFDLKTSSKETLVSVAVAAEEVEPNKQNYVDEPCMLVRLVKRNVMFMLVGVSILTMVGAVA
ncbi:beta-lactamase regulator AmpE [Glaciecola sp. MH2013]|uniref:beta-lactamase regulator AmpE n=1 Tax=Glaciecola sp. MH2013 TaxID=2785524 RepID=UPI0018A1198B|nr:beta-lactamase regulator AmpE [Glaciecola sp. MH2013]MBF7072065.1 beta-lactamase regulator AmpE [Glaciecola sp. MH2013]